MDGRRVDYRLADVGQVAGADGPVRWEAVRPRGLRAKSRGAHIKIRRMVRLAVGMALVLVLVAAGVRGAQSPPPVPLMRQLAGSWTLVSIERPGAGERVTSLPFPRGLLVLDSVGHIFEGVQHGRPQGAPVLGERQLAFATFSGFWGTYTVDSTAKTEGQSMTIRTRGAVHPNLQTSEPSGIYE